MNMHEAGETNLLPMKSHVTIKYSSISMTSYRDFLTKIESVVKYDWNKAHDQLPG